MATLYLVRHGETKDNVAKIMQGQLHGELTSAGKAQIEELAITLSDIHFDAVVSSDLKRAYDSAQILVRQKEISVEKPFPLADKVLVSIFKTIM